MASAPAHPPFSPHREPSRGWGRTIAAELRRAPFSRRWSLSGPTPPGLAASFKMITPPDGDRGADMAAGRFAHGGEQLSAPMADLIWDAPAPSAAFHHWLHRFDWLRDVLACDTAEDAGTRAEAAITLVDGWIIRFHHRDETVWAPALLARRVLAWLAAPAVFEPTRPGADTRLDALARHARQLEMTADRAPTSAERTACALAMAAAGACIAGEGRLLEAGLQRLCEAVERDVAPDGGHASRSPEQGAVLLADLYALDATLASVRCDAPEPLRHAMDRMAPMVRFFLLPGEELACFHGGGEGDRRLIRALLNCDDTKGAAFTIAPHTGYVRADTPGGAVVLDGGPPGADAAHDARAHGPLAFEFAPAGGRLIVNHGGAHATLSIDGAVAFTGDDAARRQDAASARVQVRRMDDETGVWMEGRHDGYRARFGLTHRRRLFLAAQGGELRGEDALFSSDSDGEWADHSRPPNIAPRYALHFPLHPQARATLSRDNRSAVLVTRAGERWRFRVEAGTLELRPSTYAATGARNDTPAPPAPILTAHPPRGEAVGEPAARLSWALQRMGRTPGV